MNLFLENLIESIESDKFQLNHQFMPFHEPHKILVYSGHAIMVAVLKEWFWNQKHWDHLALSC